MRWDGSVGQFGMAIFVSVLLCGDGCVVVGCGKLLDAGEWHAQCFSLDCGTFSDDCICNSSIFFCILVVCSECSFPLSYCVDFMP